MNKKTGYSTAEIDKLLEKWNETQRKKEEEISKEKWLQLRKRKRFI